VFFIDWTLPGTRKYVLYASAPITTIISNPVYKTIIWHSYCICR